MEGKIWTQVISWVLAAITVIGLLTGCSTRDAGNGTAGGALKADDSTSTAAPTDKADPNAPAWRQDTRPITLDWYINFSWFPHKWADQLTARYITEKTGVNINFIVPAGNESEKLNTMIASNSVPDLVTLHWSDDGVKKLIEGGLVYPLNKLAEQYDPYFFKTAAKSTLDWYAKEDGNVYGYPNFSTPPDKLTPDAKFDSNQTFLVRKDMYEAIGKPDMRTPEGFLNALKAAKEKFPIVNGKPMIPVAFHEFGEFGSYSLENYIWNFLAIPLEKGGKLYDRSTDPEFITWMKTLRKANEMGLVSKDIFIDKRAQMEQKIIQGRYFSMLYQHADCKEQQMILYKKNPNSVYIAVDGFANSKLEAPKLRGPGISGWTLTMISKKVKDPKRAIRFLTYGISEEGQKDFYLGKEGVTWEEVNGKPVFKPEILAEEQADPNAFAGKYGCKGTFWMFSDQVIVKKWEPELTEPLKQPLEWTYGKIVSQAPYDDIDPAADSPEGIANSMIGEKWGALLPKLILARTEQDFDQYLLEFVKEREKLGYEKIMEYRQKKFEDNKRKLGMK